MDGCFSSVINFFRRELSHLWQTITYLVCCKCFNNEINEDHNRTKSQAERNNRNVHGSSHSHNDIQLVELDGHGYLQPRPLPAVPPRADETKTLDFISTLNQNWKHLAEEKQSNAMKNENLKHLTAQRVHSQKNHYDPGHRVAAKLPVLRPVNSRVQDEEVEYEVPYYVESKSKKVYYNNYPYNPSRK